MSSPGEVVVDENARGPAEDSGGAGACEDVPMSTHTQLDCGGLDLDEVISGVIFKDAAISTEDIGMLVFPLAADVTTSVEAGDPEPVYPVVDASKCTKDLVRRDGRGVRAVVSSWVIDDTLVEVSLLLVELSPPENVAKPGLTAADVVSLDEIISIRGIDDTLVNTSLLFVLLSPREILAVPET